MKRGLIICLKCSKLAESYYEWRRRSPSGEVRIITFYHPGGGTDCTITIPKDR